MAHEIPTISVSKRERCGSRYAERLRKGGRLPAVIYGHKIDPVHVSVDEGEILTLVSHGIHAMHLDLGGNRETCLVKDLQYGYLGDNVVHVDFTRVNMDEEVTVHVHITFVGTSTEAGKTDAILRHDLTELAVNCKVLEIPEDIKVDLSKMEGTHLTAGELPLPPEVKLAEDVGAIVASVSFLRKEEEAEGEEVEVDVDAAGEPEVIVEKAGDTVADDAK